MDDFYTEPKAENSSFLMVFLFWLAGVDRETMRHCPEPDWDSVRTIAFLMIGVWLYQAGLFSLVLHRILADDGAVHPELLGIAAFIATLILLIDSYMVMRSGWHLHGIAELKRGGLDISGGIGPQILNGIFLALRILLSLGVAQLTAIFVALILFHPDVVAQIEHVYQTQNADLIATTSTQVDGGIQRMKDAVDAQSAKVTALNTQLAGMREGAAGSVSDDPQLKAAIDEVAQLNAEKLKRDSALADAQTFAANEIAGIKAAPGNSGEPGNGPVREGAEERVLAATSADTAAAQSLADARERLDNLRKQLAAQGSDRGKQAMAQLPDLKQQLATETTQLATLRQQLSDMTSNRDAAVRTAVENAPNHVGYDSGLLAQIAGLGQVAQDPEIAAVIILIDVTSFGLELAAVLAKVTSFIPTTYSALLARNSYMRTVEIVNGMEDELNKRPRRNGHVDEDAGDAPDDDATAADEGEAGQNPEGGGGDEAKDKPANENGGARVYPFGPRPSNGGDEPPPKKPRGRPRKDPPR